MSMVAMHAPLLVTKTVSRRPRTSSGASFAKAVSSLAATSRATGDEVMAGCGVGVAGFVGGAGVEEGVGEPGDGVEEPVAGVLEDVVGARELEVGVEDDVGVDVELVADPAHADPVDAVDAIDVMELVFDATDGDGVGVVHEPAVDVASGMA
jgi:hypothetical protein